MRLLSTIPILVSLTLTTLAAPTDPGRHDVAPTFEIPKSSPASNYCGKCVLKDTGSLRELRTSVPADKCNTFDRGENYAGCLNQYCGLCVTFKEENCGGSITYWGGPGAGSFDPKRARSYFCV